MMATKKEKGKLVREGMGGFLNPPGHPEHHWHIQIDLRRRPENRGGMSLESAAACEYLDPATRTTARAKLRSWQAPPLESPEIQGWIHNVLGYFRGCYRNPAAGERQWHAGEVIIDAERDPVANAANHAGINLIRKYYPDFMPTAEHFSKAYWGAKPE